MKSQFKLSIVMLAAWLASPAMATISAADAAKLGGAEFTETGAIRAGNADGTIPPHSGKRPVAAKPPASAGKWPFGDPYAADKPLYSIDAKNMAQHASKLSPGTQELMRKFPTFRIDVYPTRRDTAFPDDVLANTPKCAQTAQLHGGGDGISGVRRCVPFPFAKTGYEVLWNARLRAGAAPAQNVDFKSWLIDSNGRHTSNGHSSIITSADTDRLTGPLVFASRLINTTLTPASEAGSQVMRLTPLRSDITEPTAFSYTPAFRRTRLAPETKYDTVATSQGGLILFDEINLLDGKLDRFDYSSIKLREMIVPFNTVKSQFLPAQEVDMQNHPNPDHMRWELRRVYEVSGNLKPGQRHVNKRKVYFVEQDSWNIVGYDSYDQADRIFKTGMTQPFYRSDVGVVNAQSIVMWDLTKNVWGWVLHYHDGFIRSIPVPSESSWSPDALAGRGR